MVGIEKYIVSVIIVTYNQEKWIRQALDSVVKQKTTYPFEVIVGNDCSSDATAKICSEYSEKFPNVILLDRKKNIGCVPNWADCIQHTRGKYIMMLDGDDFWNNEDKVQIEVDYMESHPECVILHTDNDLFDIRSKVTKSNLKSTRGIDVPQGNIQDEIFHGLAHIATNSVCFRRDVFENHVPISKYIELGLLGADYPTWVILSAYGEVNYLPISTYVYRIGQESLTSRVNYDWLRHRYATEKKQAKWLMEMFPNLGTYTEADDKYYDDYCSHQLLLAAYRSNDYASARKFAKQDKMPNWKTRMARTWLTFQIARIYSIYKI